MSIWTSKVLALALLLPVPAAAEALRIAPPAGYCAGDPGAMTVLRPCEGAGAMLTVMAGAEGSASALADQGAVARWFQTDAGRAALSRRGRARDVTVRELRGRGDALLIRIADAGTRDESWRVLVPLAGRMVTLTASGGQSRELAEKFLDGMRAANRP